MWNSQTLEKTMLLSLCVYQKKPPDSGALSLLKLWVPLAGLVTFLISVSFWTLLPFLFAHCLCCTGGNSIHLLLLVYSITILIHFFLSYSVYALLWHPLYVFGFDLDSGTEIPDSWNFLRRVIRVSFHVHNKHLSNTWVHVNAMTFESPWWWGLVAWGTS